MSENKKFRYSVSKLNTYNQCPALYKRCVIDGITTPRNIKAARGSFIHKLLEHYPDIDNIVEDGLSESDMIAARKDFERIINTTNALTLINNSVAKETVILFDENFNVVEEEDSANFKGIIDLIVEKDGKYANVDWKTGKSEVNKLQLETYAVWTIKKFNLDEVASSYFYVDLNNKKNFVVKREEVPSIIKKLKDNISIIESDVNFMPKFNQNCRYCIFFNECR